MDWTLFNRVTLTFDYYNKLTKDLLFLSPTSYVTGFSSYWNNIGELKNQGLEFSISSQNIRTKDFTWTTDFNLTKQSIKVNKLPNGDDVQYGDGNMYILREGESMHTFFLPKAKGVNSETGLMEFWIDPEDESKGVTNEYSKAGSTIVGKGVPDWVGGMTNTFRYKDFDLSFMISYQFGADMFDYPGYFLTYSDGVRVVHSMYLSVWLAITGRSQVTRPSSHVLSTVTHSVLISSLPVRLSQQTTSAYVTSHSVGLCLTSRSISATCAFISVQPIHS